METAGFLYHSLSEKSLKLIYLGLIKSKKTNNNLIVKPNSFHINWSS